MNIFEEGLKHYLSGKQLSHIQGLKIGIGGAGGLGSNLAATLIRCGFKYFEILDSDTITPSNLNRQFYFINEIGKIKVETLKHRLLQINPDAQIKIHNTRWTKKTGNNFFQDCDIVAEAFDAANEKRNFAEFYQDKVKCVVSGNGIAGLLVNKKISIRKAGNLYVVGDGQTDAALGNPPMAPRVVACAAIMAEVVLDEALRSMPLG